MKGKDKQMFSKALKKKNKLAQWVEHPFYLIFSFAYGYLYVLAKEKKKKLASG
jgi:hypothetical protein